MTKNRAELEYLRKKIKKHNPFKTEDENTYVFYDNSFVNINDNNFKSHLEYRFYSYFKKMPSKKLVEDAISLSKHIIAKNGDKPKKIHKRNARVKDQVTIHIKKGGFVFVTKNGHELIKYSDLIFLWPKYMKEMAKPKRVKNSQKEIKKLRKYINCSDSEFKLLIGFLIASLYCSDVYPVLFIDGQQGTGKTFATSIVRELLDPSSCPHTAIETVEDLYMLAINQKVIAIDNCSGISPKVSDVMCQISTGGSYSKRRKFMDSDTMTVRVSSPIIVNGITALPELPDLSERSIIIRLKSIPENERKMLSTLNKELTEDIPYIFGALLNGLSYYLAHKDEVEPKSLHRLADFSHLGTTIEGAYGWKSGSFAKALAKNQKIKTALEMDASPLGKAILGLMKNNDEWGGTIEQLLNELRKKPSLHEITNQSDFPKSPTSAGKKLTRVMPTLEKQGVLVTRKHSGNRQITIRKITT